MTSEQSGATRRHYFVDEDADRAFSKSLNEFLDALNKRQRRQFLSPENVQRFRHGGTWLHPGKPEIDPGEMQQHSTVAETRFDDVVNHDLKVLPRLIEQISRALNEQFFRMFYQTVSSACDKSGNTVSNKAAGGLEQALLEMLGKIEFSATPDGKVNLPQIHAGPEVAEQLKALEEHGSPEFKAKFAELKERKIADALAKEEQRKAKFVRYGEEL